MKGKSYQRIGVWRKRMRFEKFGLAIASTLVSLVYCGRAEQIPSSPPTTVPAIAWETKSAKECLEVVKREMVSANSGRATFSFTVKNRHPSKGINWIEFYVQLFANAEPPYVFPDDSGYLPVIPRIMNLNDNLAGRDVVAPGQTRTFTFKDTKVPTGTKVFRAVVDKAEFVK
jgi:hypothetical protein